MMTFSKLLPNFAEEATMASLHMPVNNIGIVYHHNNRVVYHSIVDYMEDNYHTCL